MPDADELSFYRVSVMTIVEEERALGLDGQELEALFAELSRFNCANLSDQGRACLAVAVIGSAVHAR